MTGRTLRLAFFGTPEFAVPSLERLLAGSHPVVTIVSQPDRRRGRGRQLSPSPVSEVALRTGTPLLRPERVGDATVEQTLRESAPDLGVVVAFGQFLPRRIRELPSLGFLINGHASLLPKYRGAAPIARAILAGERLTGVSIMRVEREMDAGPFALQRQVEIGADESAGELTARLARLTADALVGVVESIAEGGIEWCDQDESQVSFAPKLTRKEFELDWGETAANLAARVRALAPAPGASTRLAGEVLRILAARVEPSSAGAPPGTIRTGGTAPLRIATGDGWLVPLRLQRSGGRAMDVEDYLRGRPIPDGARLG